MTLERRDPRIDGYGGNFRSGQVGNHGVLRNPRTQTPGQYAGLILSGPMQSLGSQGGLHRNNSDSDRWQRSTTFQKGLIPSPQTVLCVMHRAEKKYEVGKVSDEEEGKQRQFRSILNKLTHQNFKKLFRQVKVVNIDSVVTLCGVTLQIFDKALMEPTFCEMYACFCYHLAGELPDFREDNEKITFKRLLLNKCQEEFERGEREQQEADRADEDGEIKRSEKEREEKRIRARRRKLGNIRLIGELYKKKMLTERIVHECIKMLLGQYRNPDEEDIEALCELMSTIGEMIDHPKTKEHMDVYFDCIAKLSNNMKLSSRVRFMLKDAIDLRKNKWQQRRKVEVLFGLQKSLIPSPQTVLPVMLRAEKKYEVGKVSDEEEGKQRQFRAILNKLTPQNFKKLFRQVKAVNIDSVVTLCGVTLQIFDKALMEPTFCEMYASFCYHLAGELPGFSNDNEKITFKRLLLNKCQEEFERDEREQQEADRADEDGEINQSEEKRIRARTRKLGNIRLIGELYKKKMLTERVMHECIKMLLGQYRNPDEEDIEALCGLMSTIGEMIDHPKAKEHMDVYFDCIAKLSNNMKLSSRVRFMLKDAIDLRKNKWQQRRKVEVLFRLQKSLIPSPQTVLPVMLRAEKKYEVGKVSDEEEGKQRQFRAILNKLTPQNFKKLFRQVKAVNIDSVVTLCGVTFQIFDKALMEPNFCEMYASFCYHLAGELPGFSNDNKKITFKRLLLNKCQEEFERDEREQQEADRADEDGEINQSEEEREEKRIRARTRKLGNIRLIGELYKKKMLTERVMHECIKMLLGQYRNPDEEDIEALCELMSTIGEMIDHPKAKEQMDVYFDCIAKLSNNMKLSSRVRFMLKDAIDLRKNKWQQRRKVEVFFGFGLLDDRHSDGSGQPFERKWRQTSRQTYWSVQTDWCIFCHFLRIFVLFCLFCYFVYFLYYLTRTLQKYFIK
ncbi:hypothetical protein U1Q18_022999 [Sarracenia purpurea var. burkii]